MNTDGVAIEPRVASNSLPLCSQVSSQESRSAENPRDAWMRRVKQARLASGPIQKDVGIAAGLDEFVASTRINRYEVGVHQADYQMPVRLALVLDVPLAFPHRDSDEMANELVAFHRAPKALKRAATKLLILGAS